MTITIGKFGRLSSPKEDVTEYFRGLLHYPVEFAEGTTVTDLYLLLEKDIKYFENVFGFKFEETLTEGLTPAEQQYESVEFHWSPTLKYINGKANLDGHQFPMCDATKNKETYSLTFTSAAAIAASAIILKDESCLIIENEDESYKEVTLVDQEFTLLDILYSLMYELTFFGAPTKRDAQLEEFKKSLASIKTEST